MRALLLIAFVALRAIAQQVVEVAPLEPPDLNSAYASPRDAARHRLAQTLVELDSKRDAQMAVRGFADALVRDPSYALAAFNLGVAAAASRKWDDAIAAFEEAQRLDPALSKDVKPQLERLRLIATLEKSPDGQRRRRYDEALLPLLDRLPTMRAAERLFALAALGRIDPRRWEAPALIAAIGNNYEVAAKYLAIAAGNAGDPAVKAKLQNAFAAAEREVRYAVARTAAEGASDSGDHAKAGELFESAWAVAPARAANGLNAATEFLLENDTSRAALLLNRLLQTSDAELAARATAMLKHLEPVEPAVKAAALKGSSPEDPGSVDPPALAPLLPPVERTGLEVLARALPKLRPEPEPAALLASFSAEPVASDAPAVLPALPEPAATFENIWRDVQSARQRPAPAPAALPTLEAVELGQGARAKSLLISSEPPGAHVFVDDGALPTCRTPCQLTIRTGAHQFRIALDGFKVEERAVTVKAANDDVIVPLEILRGIVTVEMPAGGALKINGQAVDMTMPAPLSLLPGLYRFEADLGTVRRERMLNVRPGASLRLPLAP